MALTWHDISNLFASIEQDLISSLKRNLSRHRAWENAEGFDWPAWQAEKLKHIDAFRRDNRKIMAEYADEIDTGTRELMGEQFLEGGQDVDEGSDSAGVRGGPTIDNFFGVNEPRLESLVDEIHQSEKNAENAALRMMDDVYRRTLYKAETAMSAGATTLPQAIDMAVKDFLRSGINCIEYKNGARVNIADYVQMALRTASTRSYLQGEAKRRAQLGIDTVLVSQYGACSKTCLPWQGRVYIDDVFGDWHGERRGDMGKSSNGKWYPLLSVAVAAGLFHPNCRHTLSTWYDGISRMPDPLDPKKIQENADLEHKQRILESQIRTYKRMAEGFQQPTLVQEYKQKAAAAQKELRDFIAKHDDVLRRDYWRERTYNIHLDISEEDAILKSEIQKEPAKAIDPGKQGKHIPGHNNYIPGRSYLTISEQEAQDLVNRYAGTGELLRDRNGQWRQTELVDAGRHVGMAVSSTGEETPTSKFIIHYSKTGTHIVPTTKEMKPRGRK